MAYAAARCDGQRCCITLEPVGELRRPVAFATDAGRSPAVFELGPLLTWLGKAPVHPLTREAVTVGEGFLVPLRHGDRETAARVRRFVRRHRGTARGRLWLGVYSGLCFHACFPG